MPALRELGLHIYGHQMLSALQLGGQYGGGATLMGTPLDLLGVDYLLLGGRAPYERRTDPAGGASAVPAFASALCLCAPRHTIVTRLDPWCFTAAHIARIGANLHALAPGRMQLLLDFADAAYADETPPADTLVAYAAEVIEVVRAHWQGRIEHDGPRLRSHGRIVGPRPEGRGPAVWVRLPPLDAGDIATLAPIVDGLVVTGPRGRDSDRPRRLHGAAVVRESRPAATAVARALGLPPDSGVLADTGPAVAKGLEARLAEAGADDLVVALPGLCPDEVRWFADDVVPRLRRTEPQAGG